VQREINEIPPQELKACALLVVDAYLGLPREALLGEMARAFGFGRLGERIEKTLDPLVQALTEEGALRLQDERRYRAERPPEPVPAAIAEPAPADAAPEAPPPAG